MSVPQTPEEIRREVIRNAMLAHTDGRRAAAAMGVRQLRAIRQSEAEISLATIRARSIDMNATLDGKWEEVERLLLDAYPEGRTR